MKASPPTSQERKCSINTSALKKKRIGFCPTKSNSLQTTRLNAGEAGLPFPTASAEAEISLSHRKQLSEVDKGLSVGTFKEEKILPGPGGRHHEEPPLDLSWLLMTDPRGIQLKPQMGKTDGQDWSVILEEGAEGWPLKQSFSAQLN